MQTHSDFFALKCHKAFVPLPRKISQNTKLFKYEKKFNVFIVRHKLTEQ